MSLKRLEAALLANDLRKTRSVVLIHLSDRRSNENVMISRLKEVTGLEEVVAAHNLNIRKSASTSSSIIGKLANGKKTELLAKSGNWYTIPHGGGKGYVYASYIKVV